MSNLKDFDKFAKKHNDFDKKWKKIITKVYENKPFYIDVRGT